jgi:hypothetical protein
MLPLNSFLPSAMRLHIVNNNAGRNWQSLAQCRAAVQEVATVCCAALGGSLGMIFERGDKLG